MIRNFRFIIDGKLAGMAHPGHWEDLENSLIELKALGIGAVVSLDEFGLNDQILSRYEMNYLHLHINDFSTPSPDQVDQFVTFTDQQIKDDIGVCCHCFAGIGRTGTMLACYLVSTGIKPDDAISQVRNKPVPAIETYDQERFIAEYAKRSQSKK